MTDWRTQIWVDPLVAAGLLVPLGLLLRWGWRRLLRPMLNFLTDWHGAPARPGVPERPGVMVRVEQLEEGQLRLADGQAQIWAELSPNGGRSVKDRVEKIARHVGADDGAS